MYGKKSDQSLLSREWCWSKVKSSEHERWEDKMIVAQDMRWDDIVRISSYVLNHNNILSYLMRYFIMHHQESLQIKSSHVMLCWIKQSQAKIYLRCICGLIAYLRYISIITCIVEWFNMIWYDMIWYHVTALHCTTQRCIDMSMLLCFQTHYSYHVYVNYCESIT